MRDRLRRLIAGQDGPGLLELGAIVLFIAGVVVVAWIFLGDQASRVLMTGSQGV